MTITPAPATPSDEHVFLIGRPPVGEFLGFMRALAVDGQQQNQGQLVSEWRTANDHVLQLEADEAGIADNPRLIEIPPELNDLCDQVLANAYFQRAFQFVPTDVAIVELDRMVVFQKHIDLSHVARMRASLPAQPTLRELFEISIPLNPQTLPVRVMQTAPNSFTFVSPSNDFRYVEPILLQHQQVKSYTASGPVTAIIGIVLGYGSNFLNALHIENRLILNNGSHRAYALREHGVTHVPCLVQRLTRRDELELVASEELRQNADRYLKSQRPPLLKDYFDARLRKIVNVARKHRMVKIAFGVEPSEVPAQ